MFLPRRSVVPDPQVADRLAALRPATAPDTGGAAGWVAPAPDDPDPPVDSEPPSVPQAWALRGPWPAAPERSWSYHDGQGEVEQDNTEPEPTLVQRLRSGRLDPGPRGVAALALVAVVAAAVTAVVVVRARPQAVTPTAVVSAAAVVASSSPMPSADAPRLVVAVAGDVRRPGLVRLPPDSRVADAIRAAGGPLRAADLELVNLARKLVDGEQVVVGPAAARSRRGPAAAGPAAADPVLDLNVASAQDLQALPGIGPVLAGKIIDYRTEHGRFASVDQLREVSGIGESRFSDLQDRVRV